jgi:GntR family transcriptional repressor for pyruvate dehydrogenase complex
VPAAREHRRAEGESVLQKVKRTRLYEAVEAQLAELIRRGELRPGDRLPPEREMAQRMQVSRASVREALRMMERRGLVVSRPGAGTFIPSGNAEALARSLTHLAVDDVMELRLLLEPAIAALAARRATPEALARLEAVLQEQAQQVRLGQPAAAADAAFHAALAEATHNRALVRLGAALAEVLAPSRDDSLQTPRRAELSLRSHQAILAAIRAGAPDEARQAMAAHLHGVDLALFGLPQERLDAAAVLGLGGPIAETIGDGRYG